ncbi:MAG: hypothetical protein U9N51_01880, partial [Bacteroidota bacterium]|nr:hypothetical protein [Bacteroidota bacterium]
MKRYLFLTCILFVLSALAFSQVENSNKGLRINHNENGAVRSSSEAANANTLLLQNNEQTKCAEIFENDAI